MAFLLALFYSIVSCVEGLQRTFSGVLEVFVNVLWVIFLARSRWLICRICRMQARADQYYCLHQV